MDMFNFFRKRSNPKLSEEVLWIPGDWKGSQSFVISIAENNLGEFIFAGFIMMDIQTQESFMVETYDQHSLENREMFKEHRNANFFIRVDMKKSKFKSLESIIRVGNAILKAGGEAIFLERNGRSYSTKEWNELKLV